MILLPIHFNKLLLFCTKQFVEPNTTGQTTGGTTLAYYDFDAEAPYFYGPGYGWLRIKSINPDEFTFCKKASERPYKEVKPPGMPFVRTIHNFTKVAYF